MTHSLYTDGSAIPNPGPCGCGAVLVQDDEDKVVWSLSEYLGQGTNNVGELTAILRGCELAASQSQEHDIKGLVIYSDSELSVHLLTGVKQTKKAHLQKLVDKIDAVRSQVQFDIEIKWIKAHNNHKWNEYADALANNAVSMFSASMSIGANRAPTIVITNASTSVVEPTKIHLKCPFGEKDQVKKLGARWDAGSKTWWVVDSAESRATFAKWIV